MQIHFRYSGGFTGIKFGCDLDLLKLPKIDAARLLNLINNSNLEKVGIQHSKRGKDLLKYKITLNNDNKSITAEFDDMTIPPETQSLLNFLLEKSKPLSDKKD